MIAKHRFLPFVGALAYMALSHFLSKVYPTAWQLGLGLLLVVIALFARNGLSPAQRASADAVGQAGNRQHAALLPWRGDAMR